MANHHLHACNRTQAAVDMTSPGMVLNAGNRDPLRRICDENALKQVTAFLGDLDICRELVLNPQYSLQHLQHRPAMVA